MNFMPTFIVGSLAILVAGVTFVVQRHTQIIYKIKEKQKDVNEKQKQISEIYKTGDFKDEAVKKKLDDLQKDIMSTTMEMMKVNFKNMLWILLFSLIIFVYIATFIKEPFPFGTFLGISAPFVWYIVVSLIANILFRIVFYILEKNNVVSDTY